MAAGDRNRSRARILVTMCTGWHGAPDTSRTLLLTALPRRSIRSLRPPPDPPLPLLTRRILNLFMPGMPGKSRFPPFPSFEVVRSIGCELFRTHPLTKRLPKRRTKPECTSIVISDFN